MGVGTGWVVTQWSVYDLSSMVSKGRMYWGMVKYGNFSRNFRDLFYSGMAGRSWGKKGRMEDWFMCRKGKVVRGHEVCWLWRSRVNHFGQLGGFFSTLGASGAFCGTL